MNDAEVEALQRQVAGLLADTVSPRATMDRVATLLTLRLPGARACAVSLGRSGTPPIHVAGHEIRAATPETDVLVAPIAGAGTKNGYGRLLLQVTRGGVRSEATRELLTWVGQALVPLARIALAIDVPHTPRPDS
jgi:hypothetical protein